MNRSRVTGDLASQGNIFVDIANDRVGIGSTIPTNKLDIRGIVESRSAINFHEGLWTGETTKIQLQAGYLHIEGGSNGTIFRRLSGGNCFQITSAGHLAVAVDSTYDIGTNASRIRNIYADTLYGDGSNLTGIDAGTLKHSNNTKAQATAYGVEVTGTIDTDGLIVSGVSTTTGNITGTGDLILTDTTADSAAGPEFKLFRNSASPADADYIGQIKFAGENDNNEEINYAKITGKILDASDGTEDGIIEFAHIKAGSQTITGRWRSDSLQLLNDTNLTVDGTTTLNNSITLNSDDSSPARIDLYCEVSNAHYTRLQAPAHSTYSGNVTVTIPNASGNLAVLANAADNRIVTATGTHGMTGESNLTFDGNNLAMSGTGVFTITRNSRTLTLEGNYGNEGHPAIKTSSNHDLRIFTSGNNERLRITSGGRFLLGTTASRTIAGHSPRFTLNGDDYSAATLQITSNQNGTSGTFLQFSHQRSGSAGGNTILQSGDDFGRIRFTGGDGTNIDSRGAEIIAQVDGTPGVDDMPGRLMFMTTADGSQSTTERLRIKSNGQIVLGSDGTNSELTFSQDGTSGTILNSTTTGFGGYNTFTVNSAQFVHKYGSNERLRIDSDGRLLYGKTSSTLETSLVLVGNSNSYTTNPGVLQLEMGNTPSNLASLGIISFGSQDKIGARIDGRADQDWNINSAHGTHIRFLTTANGSASNPTERARITSAGDFSIGGRDAALANYADGSTTPTQLAVVKDGGAAGSGYHEVAHFTGGSDSNDTGAIVRITQFNNDRGLYIKAGRGTSDQAKAIFGLRNSSAGEADVMTFLQGGVVGINNGSPTQGQLVVSNSSGNTIALCKTGNAGAIAFGGPSQPRILMEAGQSSSDLLIYTAQGSSWGTPTWQEKFRINSNGALGLGGATYGSSGQVLTSAGSGSVPTWTTISGTTINNNANNRIITGSGTANTLEAESNLTFDNATIDLHGGQSSSSNYMVLRIEDTYHRKILFAEATSSHTPGTYGGFIGYDAQNNLTTIGTNHNSNSYNGITITREGGYVLSPTCPKFSAYMANTYSWNNQIIVWDSELYDIGSNYNTSNGKFTAPVTGYYVFGVKFRANGGFSQFGGMWTRNSSTYKRAFGQNSYAQGDCITAVDVIPMSANDTMGLRFEGSHGGATGGAHENGFWGYLLG